MCLPLNFVWNQLRVAQHEFSCLALNGTKKSASSRTAYYSDHNNLGYPHHPKNQFPRFLSRIIPLTVFYIYKSKCSHTQVCFLRDSRLPASLTGHAALLIGCFTGGYLRFPWVLSTVNELRKKRSHTTRLN